MERTVVFLGFSQYQHRKYKGKNNLHSAETRHNHVLTEVMFVMILKATYSLVQRRTWPTMAQLCQNQPLLIWVTREKQKGWHDMGKRCNRCHHFFVRRESNDK